MGFCDRSDFKIERGESCLAVYQFNTRVAKHYFCRNCGIYTHHQRRSIPTQIAFNVGCLDGIDPNLLSKVAVIDAANNHPCDHGQDK